MTVYGSLERVEFFSVFVRAIQSAVPGFTGPPTDPPPLPFQLQDPQRLERELRRAGLEDVSVETIVENLHFESGEHLWSWLMNSNPIPRLILEGLELTPAQEASLRRELDQAVRERADGNGSARLTNPIHIGVATR